MCIRDRVNRYEGNDNIALGLVRGFGTKTGALASTVSHDSHNLTIVYDNPEEALMAAEELARTGGGMCAVKEGKILHTLALPLAGLMSLKPAEELAEDSAVMKDANRALGLTNMENPLLRIVTPVSYTHLDVYKRQPLYRWEEMFRCDSQRL